MKKHHKTISYILLAACVFLSLISTTKASLIDDLEKEINAKRAQIQELEKKLIELQGAIKSSQSQQTTLKKQIGALEAQISQLKFEIQLTQARISEANLEIEKLDYDINQSADEIVINKRYLANVIQTIYEYDQATLLEIILQSPSFSDLLNQIQYAENLQQAVQEKLETIQSLKARLEGKKEQQEGLKDNLESLSEELEGKKTALDSQKGNKTDLLASTKNQEKKYQAQLQDLKKKREEIQKEIYLLEDKLRLTIDPSSIPPAQKGLLEWPIKNVITQTYGPTSETGFINNVYNFHNGIDIRAALGAPIKSAYDGIVSGVGNDGKYAYGKWIAINHNNGLTTLYGHFSAIKVSTGQKVSRGEVIGYSGDTGFATGPHLHFTVYATNTFRIESRWYGLLPLGGSINPMNYLE